jgi:RNA 2',3'-cyclic 3'-phosphodiesterase
VAAGRGGAMRIFVAVFPPPAVQEAATSLVDQLRRPGDGVSWVRLQNLHYTLRFLGELGESGLARATQAAQEGVVGHRPFDATLGAAGAFPRASRARVLWLGLARGEEPFTALAESVEQALRGRGFGRADHRFTAHLTIGRVPERDQDWSERLAALAAAPGAGFVVDRVAVVQSTLSPKGSTYQVRAEAMLTQAGGSDA